MADPGLEYFLIRTLPNKKRSLIVALRYGNRSKWRYQSVVPRVKVGLDLAETEAFTDAVENGPVPPGYPKYVRIERLNRRELILQVSGSRQFSQGIKYYRWNRMNNHSEEFLRELQLGANPTLVASDKYLIALGTKIVFIPISKLDQHQEHKLEYEISVLRQFRFEEEIWILENFDSYYRISKTFSMIDLKKFDKAYRTSLTGQVPMDSFVTTWANTKKNGLRDFCAILADRKNYYLHFDKKLKSISRKNHEIVGLFEVFSQGAQINGVTCRNSNLLYVSTYEALYCLRAGSLKLVTMQSYPEKRLFRGSVHTMIFSGVEFVVCTNICRILVAACINFKFQYIYDTEKSGYFECPPEKVPITKLQYAIQTPEGSRGRIYLSGDQVNKGLLVARFVLA